MGVEGQTEHKESPLEWVLKDAQKSPGGADGKAFPGRGYNRAGLKCKRVETESCSFYCLTSYWSPPGQVPAVNGVTVLHWLNLTAYGEKERTVSLLSGHWPNTHVSISPELFLWTALQEWPIWMPKSTQT